MLVYHNSNNKTIVFYDRSYSIDIFCDSNHRANTTATVASARLSYAHDKLYCWLRILSMAQGYCLCVHTRPFCVMRARCTHETHSHSRTRIGNYYTLEHRWRVLVARRVTVHTRKGMSRHKFISTHGRAEGVQRVYVFFARYHKFTYCFRLTRRDATAAAAGMPGVLFPSLVVYRRTLDGRFVTCVLFRPKALTDCLGSARWQRRQRRRRRIGKAPSSRSQLPGSENSRTRVI